MLICETGVPDMYIEVDEWGGRKMARLEDGWCSALDRNTMKCLIYDKRPWICRDFKMGSKDCITERAKPIVP
jgi:Fe-S-cluster containining protein